jgi:hypothetical protein
LCTEIVRDSAYHVDAMFHFAKTVGRIAYRIKP